MTTETLAAAPYALDADAQDLLFREARTANTFTDEEVTDEQLAAIYDLAQWGPTAMNSQPLRILFLRQGEARERLVAHMAEGNKGKTLAAPVVAVLAADVRFHDELPTVFPHAPGIRDGLEPNEAGRLAMATLNGSLQVGYFIVAARAVGLAAGPMSGLDATGIDAELFPDGDHRTLVVVNLGRPAADAWQERLPRLPFDAAVTVL
ncbi:MAG: malonic semialdehyde reductase [Nocardioides sp.]|nr:malonic semialdehyde reductase [Nocardioides sp.]